MIGLILFISSLVQGITSFGFSVVALPLLGLFMDVREVVPMLTIYSVLLNIYILINLYKHIRIKKIALLAAFGILGIPVGSFLLSYLDQYIIKVSTGIILFIYSSALLLNYSKKLSDSKFNTAIIGFVSGIMGGATSLSGPIVVLFLSDKVSKQEFRANLTLYFFTLNMIAIPSYLRLGTINIDKIFSSLFLSPVIILGVAIGVIIGNKIDEQKFKRGVLYFILVFSLSLFFR
jgi:uncharacterized membrane protein YfcA